MKALIQRVRGARVEVDGEVVGAIDQGLLALVGEQGQQARPLPGISRPIHLIYRPSSLKRDRASRLIQALTRHFAKLAPLDR